MSFKAVHAEKDDSSNDFHIKWQIFSPIIGKNGPR
jgi:hypothetical protein